MNALTARTLAQGYYSRAAQTRAGSIHGEALAQRYESIARALEATPEKCDIDAWGNVTVAA